MASRTAISSRTIAPAHSASAATCEGRSYELATRPRSRPRGTHHVLDDAPLYSVRFDDVLSFHEPGLAAVRAGMEAFHVRADGSAAYARRFLRAFGFYEGIATV